MMQIEFSGDFPNCDPSLRDCSGQQALESFGLDNVLPPGVDVVLALTIWAALVISAYLILAILTRIRYRAS